MLFAFLLSVAILSTISIIRAHAFVQPEHGALRQIRGDCRPNLILTGRLPMLKFNMLEQNFVSSMANSLFFQHQRAISPS
jgi:hypothetical protein